MEANPANKNLIVFLDTLGRTIFAEKCDEKTTAEKLAVFNPVVVQVNPNPQTGQMSLQLFPLFFREFMAEKDEKILWFYNRSMIAENEGVTFDFKLYMQYNSMFGSAAKEETPAAPKANNVIKLFDE